MSSNHTFASQFRVQRPSTGTLILGFLLLLLLVPLDQPAAGQTPGSGSDPARAGRFDMGKMWTFENAPMAYFTETYGFSADPAWFERARLAALRIPGCSAAFVSPNGLVVTNHHCARGAVVSVTREGESLLDDGFYASSLEEERSIPNYYVDQLIAAEDVSDEVFRAVDQAMGDAAKEAARREVISRIQERISSGHAGGEGAVRVEVTALYNGGRYSAYTYRRFSDVRMVAAAELELGFFGGDPDNFTYPRYALDFAFLRVYGSDGEPLETEHYFGWSLDGVQENDVVFVIGNPGPTNRLNTVAQLEFQRDVSVAAQKSFLGSRLAIMKEFYDENPEQGEAMGLRNQMFGLSNSLKANSGRLDALKDPVIMERKGDGERLFQEALDADPELRAEWGGLIQDMAAIQEEKMALAPEYFAFLRLVPGNTESSLLIRGIYAVQYLQARDGGASPAQLDRIRGQILGITDKPEEMEEAFLAERLGDFQRYLGSDHPVTAAALEGRSVEGATTHLRARSALATAESTAGALEGGALDSSDPAVRLAGALLPSLVGLPSGEGFQTRLNALSAQERELAADLGRARFAVYGPDVPPDASRSPRITDGVVKPYTYNGTLAPVYTTFFGLYDHFHSYGRESDWNLPDRWLPPHPDLDLGTPLNFISTADTYGGNSGSPAVTPNLEIVGLNFDRNVEGLSRDFIFLPDRGRNIMVDVRAIKEAMDVVYDADRIVQEILTHRLFRTEAEADAVGR
ncbi:MAG: S46 family peptidase [Gemmatimonadetes bacterium]|nr:S46 family peptidase [Gemmatimonadota bacterium]NNM06180.1 S46 family peptidase [Gemmatimonadota bacterium]